MTAVACIVMAWLGWEQYRPDESGAPETRPTAATEPAGRAAEEGAAASHVGERDEQLPLDAAAATPRPLVSSGARRSRSSEDIAEKRRLLGKSFQAYSAPADGTTDAATDEAARSAPEAASDVAGPVAEAAAEPEGDTGMTVAALAADSRDALTEAGSVQVPREETISYWQIPGSTRSGMPEMRIRVLVYADQPEDRFLLINDKRLREGDELEPGLRLEEIRRDRAIFTYRDYRFHLKS
ncbi:general secretion pathway protein GspB [Elongatibacter sediminis]|uniref:General secretion pathway protein GspB n=1 Tax=Elongatibacter sediminis TaxID=3119006 RepID=A0AAW9RBY2_9GAMM